MYNTYIYYDAFMFFVCLYFMYALLLVYILFVLLQVQLLSTGRTNLLGYVSNESKPRNTLSSGTPEAYF